MSSPAHEPSSMPPEARGIAGVLEQREWRLPWQAAFLEALARQPNVSAAARHAGVNRHYVYDVRVQDEEFAKAWKEAHDVGVELMEQIAHRRATIGEPRRTTTTRVKRQRNEQGEMVVIEENTTVEESTWISDTMLMFMLRAHRPDRYRENYESGSPSDLPPPTFDEVYRQPSPERARALARMAVEQGVVDGVAHQVEPNGDGPKGTP